MVHKCTLSRDIYDDIDSTAWRRLPPKDAQHAPEVSHVQCEIANRMCPLTFQRDAKIASSEHMRIGGSEEMAWLQICEPTEKDKGKYTFEILDGKKNHQRSLDLSGQGKITVLWPLVILY